MKSGLRKQDKHCTVYMHKDNSEKKFYILIAVFFITLVVLSFIGAIAFAQTNVNIFRNIVPETNNIYHLGTSTKLWAEVWAGFNTSGATRCLQITSGGQFGIASAGCGTGSGSAYLESKWATSTTDTTAILPASALRVGIGTTSPASIFSVHGNAFIAGTTTSGSLVATGTISVLGTATSTFAGTVTIGSSTPLSQNFNPVLLVSRPLPSFTVPLAIFENPERGASPQSFITLIRGDDVGSMITGARGTKIFHSNVGTGFQNYEGTPITLWTGLGSGSVERFRVTETGTVGVATTSPAATFAVHGNAFLGGATTTVSDLTATGSIKVLGRSGAGTVTATSTIENGLQVTTGGLAISTIQGCSSTFALSTDASGNVICDVLPTVPWKQNSVTGLIAPGLTIYPVAIGSGVAAGPTQTTFSVFATSTGNRIVTIRGTTNQSQNYFTIQNVTPHDIYSIKPFTGSSTALEFNIGGPSTTTVNNNQQNVWSVATATTDTPIISVSTASGVRRVGIATNNPQQTLDVNGTLRVATTSANGVLLNPQGSNYADGDIAPQGQGSLRVGLDEWAFRSDFAPYLNTGLFFSSNGRGDWYDASGIVSSWTHVFGGVSAYRDGLAISQNLSNVTTAACCKTLANDSSSIFRVFGAASFDTKVTTSNLLASSTIQASTTISVATSSPVTTLSVQGSAFISGTTTTGSLFATSTVILKNLPAPSATQNSVCISGTNKNLFENAASSCLISLRESKKDIADIGYQNAKSSIMALRPVDFTYKLDGEKSKGFIAEEVAKVDARYGAYDEKGKLVSYEPSTIIADLVKVVQEQEKRIQELERRLK